MEPENIDDNEYEPTITDLEIDLRALADDLDTVSGTADDAKEKAKNAFEAIDPLRTRIRAIENALRAHGIEV